MKDDSPWLVDDSLPQAMHQGEAEFRVLPREKITVETTYLREVAGAHEQVHRGPIIDVLDAAQR
jgi:hypothetical protein